MVIVTALPIVPALTLTELERGIVVRLRLAETVIVPCRPLFGLKVQETGSILVPSALWLMVLEPLASVYSSPEVCHVGLLEWTERPSKLRVSVLSP